MLFLFSNKAKMNRLLFSFILLVFFFLGVQAQNNKNQMPKTTRTVYSYSFTGVQNEQQLSLLQEQMSSLTYVESVKTKFKPENKAAQVILIVAIENNGSEERKDFEMGQLKQIISKNGFEPGDLTIRELEAQEN